MVVPWLFQTRPNACKKSFQLEVRPSDTHLRCRICNVSLAFVTIVSCALWVVDAYLW